MLYEVELKFLLPDQRPVLAALAEMGGVAGAPVEQVDRYFNHPCRDFFVTDEAFRIRSAGSATAGTANWLTYKGPVIDRETKMRQEIEVPVAEGAAGAGQLTEIMVQLGFRPVWDVRKFRTPWKLTWNCQPFELALDAVPPLGVFLEIELVVEESGRDAARQAILELARRLNLTDPERRSYLELLLASDQASIEPEPAA